MNQDTIAREHKKAVKYLKKADPIMAKAIALVGPSTFMLRGERSIEHALIRAVAHQQIHGKAAQKIMGRFLDFFPNGNNAFPPPELIVKVTPEEFRSFGFSESKTKAILDIAHAALDGRIPTLEEAAHLSDDDLIKRLVPLRGVGRWTVEMLLIFTLGRLDVLPVDDFAVREGYKILKGMRQQPKPKTLMRYGKKWAPYRSVASWYLWRIADKNKKIQ